MKYENSKNLKAAQILKYIQKFVKKNSAELKRNNDDAHKIMNSNENPYKLDELDWLNARNKKLIKQNSQYLELHTRLVDFLKSISSLKEEFEVDNSNVQEDDNEQINFYDMFENTIEGKVEFNENHPFFGNDEFKKMLMEYYINKEEYEICQKLSKS